jgi:hypothetical protein
VSGQNATEPALNSPSSENVAPGAQAKSQLPDAQALSGLDTANPSSEKFAVEEPSARSFAEMRKSSLFKSGLGVSDKEVTAQAPRIGIGVATEVSTMPSGSTLDHSVSHVAPAATVAASETRSDSPLPQMVALPSTAHRAVEAVLSATERFAARDQHSVNLQFSVGGSDLNVRVELRGNEVHTTFRTDSADLRNALASEWRAVAQSSNEDRPVRLATPVFTASSNAGNFSSDDSRRQSAADREQQPSWTSFLGRQEEPTTQASMPTASASRTVALNSRHLHTLA